MMEERDEGVRVVMKKKLRFCTKICLCGVFQLRSDIGKRVTPAKPDASS